MGLLYNPGNKISTVSFFCFCCCDWGYEYKDCFREFIDFWFMEMIYNHMLETVLFYFLLQITNAASSVQMECLSCDKVMSKLYSEIL